MKSAPSAIAFLICAIALVNAVRAPPPPQTGFRAFKPQPAIHSGEQPGDVSPQPEGQRSGTAIEREIAALRDKTDRPDATVVAWVKLGDGLMQKSRESQDTRLLEEAESAYTKALALDPKHEDAMVGLAWVHNTEHEFDEGRRWAEKALAINPRLPQAHALLGDAAVELGDYDAAFEYYQKALDLRPDLSTYSRSAHLLWMTGDVRKARWLMQKAIDSGGPYAENTAWCRAELALMLWRDGALLPAAQQAEQALKQAPQSPHVFAVLGRIKTAGKDFDAAIDCYRRAVEIAPSHEALVALGDLFLLKGRPEEAEKQYERLVQMHTAGTAHAHGANVHAHPSGHGNAQLAQFYADHDRNLDEALKEAESAYQTYKNVFVADTLAWCYYKKGLYEQARKTVRKALRWNTPDANIFFHAGMIYAKLGESNVARKYLYRALNLNPHFHPKHAPIAADTLKELAGRLPESKAPDLPSSGGAAKLREGGGD
ncbi:MAG: tetratricopeptide repeat protein [Verrucomicrobia bacterium]|nr:tetratricopeptide repeat protein [Verrucomicrobiota bacterium]